MVTRTVIRVTPSEAAALAATESWSSAEAVSIIKNATAQSTKNGSNSIENRVEKKRALPSPSGGVISEREKKKRQNADRFVLDLSDVPPQLPIVKNKGRIKEGASKYTGAYLHKVTNKWQAMIRIEGKERHIGYYENEEEAAVDYARAVYKYRGQEALDKARKRNSSGIDLSGVPPQSPILKSEGLLTEGASKYVGVTLDERTNKLKAQIMIAGKKQSIGYYENEELAAVDYARAVFKFKGPQALDKARERSSSKSGTSIERCSSTATGNQKQSTNERGFFNTPMNKKWKARILMGGKHRSIG